MIALLQQQISFFAATTPGGEPQGGRPPEGGRASLRNLLERKSEEEAKQKRVIKGLAKISQNKSEKQPSAPASQEAVPGQPSEKKERAHTNNGAKRKQHLEVEVVEENVDPEDPRFNKDLGKTVQDKGRDTLRAHPHALHQEGISRADVYPNDEYFSGKAPRRAVPQLAVRRLVHRGHGTAQVHVRNAGGENREALQRQRFRHGQGNGAWPAPKDGEAFREPLPCARRRHQGGHIHRRRRDIPQGTC